MLRLLITLFTMALLVAGMIAGWLLRVVPPANPIPWLAPFLMICSSGWILWRLHGRALTLPLLFVTAVVSWVIIRFFWPAQHTEVAASSPPVLAETVATATLIEIPVHIPPSLQKGAFSVPRTLMAPPGARISLYATDLGAVRMMAWSKDGTLLATVPKAGRVVALPDRNADGIADRVVVVAKDLDRPHGLAVRGKEILVAENGRILGLHDDDGDLKVERIEVLSTDVPAGGGHWTRSLVIGSGGELFLSAGSSCNVCEEQDPRRASIMRYAAMGGGAEIFARGLRNSVGMTIHPETGALWASDNGRDMLGDNLPPDEINLIVSGGDYGWPYCYAGRTPDPEYGNPERCRQTIAPAVQLQAHSAPLGIDFADAADLPHLDAEQALLVAYHGSWNRRVPTGYKLVAIPFRDGRPNGEVVDLLSGWLREGQAWGRPVAPLMADDGTLFLSDDRAGAIYRITFNGKADASGG